MTQDANERNLPILVGISPRHTSGTLDPLAPVASQILVDLDSSRVHLIDLHEVLANQRDLSSLYIDPVHYNKEGHQTIGLVLGNAIHDMLLDKLSTFEKNHSLH